MALEPLAKKITVRFPNGSVAASMAAINKLIGTQVLGWNAPITDSDFLKRRPYGSTRVSRASAGAAALVTFRDGSTWTYRVTGTQKNFLRYFLQDSDSDNVVSIKFPRKTRYGSVPQQQVP